ncbi:MAG: excinuclease ABC subunit C [Kiritimatiellaceae bacterium]|nr:excinuclease ABC subunit C [Kiritimatiellaceae bacterium]
MKRTVEIKNKLKMVPDQPGCYLMRDADGKIIYIGKAKSLRKRVQSYFRPHTLRTAPAKTRNLIRAISSFDYIELKSDAEAILTEGRLIKEYRPHYNILWKDDKRFLNIRIDIHHPFPMVSTCRLRKQDGSIYFGPYISGRAAAVAVDFVQRFFGLKRCRVREPDAETYRHCSDDRIANCSAPCINSISMQQYKKKAEEAVAFLRGERMELLRHLREEMKQMSVEQRFEEAAAHRDLLLDIQQTVKSRANVKRTPKMLQEEAFKGLKELQELLGLERIPAVIECFDISNISGSSSVASMVVGIDGMPVPKSYRRYKIKTVEGADDPRSMAEVVYRRYRRLKKMQSPLPDLVMVDGGITQLRAAHAALCEMDLMDLPIVGLAKRYEEIVWDVENNSGNIKLPPHSNALHVVTRLRDEAHRFAVTFHRSLRAQRILESQLDEIPGIGHKKKKILLTHFGSISRMKRASLEALMEASGIGLKTAKIIYDELNKKESS